MPIIRNFDSSYLIMDDFKGAYIAVEHLLQLGHRRIACCYKTDDRQGCDRKKGYLKALEAYGVKGDEALIGEYSTADMYLFPYMFCPVVVAFGEQAYSFFLL